MKISDLKSVLSRNGIFDEEYSLSEDEPPLADTVVCLRRRGSGYEVYISDRNMKSNRRYFLSEEEACEYILRLFRIAC